MYWKATLRSFRSLLFSRMNNPNTVTKAVCKWLSSPSHPMSVPALNFQGNIAAVWKGWDDDGLVLWRWDLHQSDCFHVALVVCILNGYLMKSWKSLVEHSKCSVYARFRDSKCVSGLHPEYSCVGWARGDPVTHGGCWGRSWLFGHAQ